MKGPVILLLLAASPCAFAFVPSSPNAARLITGLSMLRDTDDNVNRRSLLLSSGSFVAASILGFEGVKPAEAIPEQKVYSSNARNMMRLGEGDSSGGSGESFTLDDECDVNSSLTHFLLTLCIQYMTTIHLLQRQELEEQW